MNMIALITAAAFLVQPGPEAPKAKVPPGTPRVLVMKDLSRRPVRLLAVGAEQVQVSTLRGTRSRTSSVPRRDVLAVLADDSAALPATAGEAWLRTTSGEVLAGGLTPPDKPGAETLVWRTARLGDLTFKLDEVKRLDFLPVVGDPGPGKPGEDRVLLSNGDVLAGFLESVGETVTVEVAKQKRQAPLASVARVELSNAVKPASGLVVWLTDGQVLRATSLSGTGGGAGGGATIVREGKPTAVPSAEIAGFVEDAAALRPLAEFPPASVAPFGKRAWAGALEVGDSAVPLGAADVTLPSPMVVTWALPEGARRLSARVVLPAASRVWGDCVVIVEQTGVKGVGGKELGRFHLSGEAPEAELNVELLSGGGPVRVTLDEGANGPIQDRVMLRQPLVLIEKK